MDQRAEESGVTPHHRSPALNDALPFVLAHEGGWYPGDQKRDPNPTMNGITQATYDSFRVNEGLPIRSVRLIEEPELGFIYTHMYWYPSRAHRLPGSLAVTHFDHAVNAGPREAIRLLQRVIRAKPDGLWGPKTEAALETALHEFNAWELSLRYNAERIGFYHRLCARKPHLRPNLMSWVGRVAGHHDSYLT